MKGILAPSLSIELPRANANTDPPRIVGRKPQIAHVPYTMVEIEKFEVEERRQFWVGACVGETCPIGGKTCYCEKPFADYSGGPKPEDEGLEGSFPLAVTEAVLWELGDGTPKLNEFATFQRRKRKGGTVVLAGKTNSAYDIPPSASDWPASQYFQALTGRDCVDRTEACPKTDFKYGCYGYGTSDDGAFLIIPHLVHDISGVQLAAGLLTRFLPSFQFGPKTKAEAEAEAKAEAKNRADTYVKSLLKEEGHPDHTHYYDSHNPRVIESRDKKEWIVVAREKVKIPSPKECDSSEHLDRLKKMFELVENDKHRRLERRHTTQAQDDSQEAKPKPYVHQPKSLRDLKTGDFWVKAAQSVCQGLTEVSCAGPGDR